MTRTALLALLSFSLCCCRSLDSRLRPGQSHAGSGTSPLQPVSGHIAPQGNVLSYADTAERVAPAVVPVPAARRVRQPRQFQFDGDPFSWFFGGGNPRGGMG